MSSKGEVNESSGKGKNDVDQVNQRMGDMSLDSSRGSGWEASLKEKNGARNGAVWGPWGEQMKAIPLPLQGGWNLKSDAAVVVPENVLLGPEDVDDGYNGNDSEDLDESEDELVTDDYDSDESQQSHDSRKKNPWFASLFGTLDSLTLDEINEPLRQWHCPACQNGPGSIHWFIGLQSFLTHVKTKGARRVKIHQDLAQLLDEELSRRGAKLVHAGEMYGRWKGLDEVVKDQKIIWPPMVIIMNTQLEQDENEMWVGMGSPELLDYFNSYDAVKARHSFGPKGHRGMSVLIFETSAVGYLEAERLNKRFDDQGKGRDTWDHHPNLFSPGGKRQLYGFMATTSDLDIFNRHSPGKLKLKFELVSYQEKVVDQLKQMNEDNQQLIWYKNKMTRLERDLKASEEGFELLSQKLRKHEEENLIVRQRTQMYHEQNKEEMDFQEQFFKEQLKVIQAARDALEENFEESQSVDKSCAVSDSQDRKGKEMEEEMEKARKEQEEERVELKLRHRKEEVEMEERFNARFVHLTHSFTH